MKGKLGLKYSFLLFVTLVLAFAFNTQPTYKFAVLKYNGGGDWYANPTSLPNLVKFCNEKLKTNINLETEFVQAGSPDLFNFPFVHMTGHGNVIFSALEAENIRNYLIKGGFLHIDDNYGMDQFVRRELKKVFPTQELVELPFNHPIFHQTYNFNEGLPKIHEHDNKAPQGFGLFHEGRLVVFYSYETDLGDGWEDSEVHKDKTETREKALKMGANIVEYALSLKNNK